MGILFQEVYILVLVMTITPCCLFVCGDAACAAVCAEERASLLPVVAEPPAAIVQVTPEATVVEMPAVISEPPSGGPPSRARRRGAADGGDAAPPPAPPGIAPADPKTRAGRRSGDCPGEVEASVQVFRHGDGFECARRQLIVPSEPVRAG